jgi:hypothetical protein
LITCRTPPTYFSRPRSKLRLKRPKKPFFASSPPAFTGLSIVAHSAGVSVSATSTESTMAEMIVTENCR